MKVFSIALAELGFLHTFIVVNASNLRTPAASIDNCIISAVSYLPIPGESLIGDEEEYGCDDGTGSFLPLHLGKAQEKALKNMAASGKIMYGLSKIDVRGAAINDDGFITMPPGEAITLEASTKIESPFDRHMRRDLEVGSRERHFLLFRVTDSNGLVHPDTARVMSDKVFGTGGDSVTFKSQMYSCSVGKYTIATGGRLGYDTSDLESAPGVIDITIDVSLNDSSRRTVRNAVLAKAQEVMGNHFDLPTNTSLMTYVDHTLFSLENCYLECGWAAYASVGGYYQFYQGNYYKMPGVGVHEHGHNMMLAHSGGKDGDSYSDHTCLMGNPLYDDDLGQMCFNPAKLWQLQHYPHPTTVTEGWYDSAAFVTINTPASPQEFKMMGVGEYNLQGEHVMPIALQVKANDGSGMDKYIAFNSAKGANIQNDEASNLVTIVEWQTTDGYARSMLKDYIGQGQTFNLSGTDKILEVQCINTAATPAVACVCVRSSSETCPNGCSCPVDCSKLSGGACKNTPACRFSKGSCMAI